jgi:serine/threonine protein kinase
VAVEKLLLVSDGPTNPSLHCSQVLRGDSYTEKADIHSFGVVLWELLMQQHPFMEEESNRYVLLMKLGSGQLRLAPLDPGLVGEALAKLVERCLSYDPNLRPSFQEILGELEEAQRRVKDMAPSQAAKMQGSVLAAAFCSP